MLLSILEEDMRIDEKFVEAGKDKTSVTHVLYNMPTCFYMREHSGRLLQKLAKVALTSVGSVGMPLVLFLNVCNSQAQSNILSSSSINSLWVAFYC